ncbi:unnamed protein product [Clonostachys rosea]|uniref:Nephrocystin 3-like N-terminal domain-containing protein n=1 Tax=Bionectria ochroleuca TaxID=29856 RepID=A0ABY6U998_BIOOC|nr:unnamed protein product [Clonostachys rosea]
MDDRANKILSWISDVPHQLHHEHAKSDLLDGIGKWIFEDEAFLKWKNGPRSSMLWLRGKPQSGKTKLMSLMIDDAHHTSIRKCCRAPVYFYCSEDAAEPARRDARSILASIARQLSICDDTTHELHQSTTDIYVKREARAFLSSQLDVNELEMLIVDLLAKADTKPRAIFIDSLEECGFQASGALLEFFERLLTISPSLLKLCVSSSDYEETGSSSKFMVVQITPKQNASDIEQFLRARSKQLIEKDQLLLSGSQGKELQEKILSDFVAKADGIFCWANLQLLALCQQRTHAAILDRLSTQPQSLEDLHHEILQRIETYKDKTEREIVQNALSWLLYGCETLKSDVFLEAILITVKSNHKSISKWQLLDLCAGLVIYDASLDIYRFSNSSVRHFLKKHLLKAATTNVFNADETMILLLKYLNQGFSVCEETLDIVTDNLGFGCRLMEILLQSSLVKVQISQNSLLSICRSENGQLLMDIVLQNYGSDIQLTEEVLQEVAENETCGLQLMALLLERRKADIIITENVLISAVGNEICAEDLIRLLSDEFGADGTITEDVLHAAAANPTCGDELMSLLISIRPSDFNATDLLQTAAENEGCGDRVMKVLLEKYPTELSITEDILMSAAGNEENGEQVFSVILGGSSPEIQITEDLLEVVLQNDISGERIIRLLIRGTNSKISVSSKVIQIISEGFHYERFEILLLDDRVMLVNYPEILASVAEYCGKGTLESVINKHGCDLTDEDIQQVLESAARNRTHGDTMLVYALERLAPRKKITEDLLKVAVEHAMLGDRIMLALHRRYGSNINITEGVLASAARNLECGDLVMASILKVYQDQINITDGVFEALAQNPVCGSRILEIILEKSVSQVYLTRKAIEAITNCMDGIDTEKSMKTMQLLLARSRVENVGETLLATVSHGSALPAFLDLLLSHYNCSDNISEEVVEAAVRNIFQGYQLTEYLLDRGVPVTEKVLCSAAENEGQGEDILKVLLPKLAPKSRISPTVLKAAASNTEFGASLVDLLLHHGALEADETVIHAAASNKGCGKSILELLFRQSGSKIVITQSMLKAAASGNLESLEFLLDQCQDESCVTTPVLEAAARNISGDSHLFSKIVSKCRDEVRFTEDVLQACASNVDPEIATARMKLILDGGGNALKITEATLVCIAKNWESGHDLVKWLLHKRDHDVRITRKVMRSIATNPRGKEIIKLLLKDYKDGIISSISQEVIFAAASNGRLEILKCLCQLAPSITVEPDWDPICRLYMAARDDYVDETSRLIGNNCPPDTKDSRGRSPLWIAARYGHSKIVQILVDQKGVDVNS